MFLGYIVMAFPIIAIISLFIICPILLYDKHNKCKHSAIRYIVLFVFIGYCLSLTYLTVLWYYPNITIHPQYRFYNIQPFIWISETYEMGFRRMIQQLVLNIGMYIPYGILLPMIFKKLRKISAHFVVVFLTTLSIEIVQFIIGRSADIDDVIMNFLGGLLGYLLYRMFNHILQNKQWWKEAINSNDE
ncbi:MAG: VanZ family protein [Lachnospiraceae bacterium]|nr:VanZ family protein [Lachnospiraceae bacterium]